MNPTVTAVRAGVRRGMIELRNTFTNAQDLWNYFFPTAVLLVAMFFMRGSTVPGTDFSLGARALPSTHVPICADSPSLALRSVPTRRL